MLLTASNSRPPLDFNSSDQIGDQDKRRLQSSEPRTPTLGRSDERALLRTSACPLTTRRGLRRGPPRDAPIVHREGVALLGHLLAL